LTVVGSFSIRFGVLRHIQFYDYILNYLKIYNIYVSYIIQYNSHIKFIIIHNKFSEILLMILNNTTSGVIFKT